MRRVTIASALLCVVAAGLAAAPPAPQGVITGRAYLGIGGTAVANLTNSVKYINGQPDVVVYLPYFEWNATGDIYTIPPSNWADNYGAEIIGYFYPPATGEYWFYICSDDNSVLYLSTDDNPANKKVIAIEPNWNDRRQWETTARRNANNPENCSATYLGTQWPTKDPVMGGAIITLQGRKPYFIQALMKEGGGGDNLSVAVADFTGNIPSVPGALIPIPGDYLATIDKQSGPAIITKQPESVTVNEGESVTFAVEVDGTPPYTYQWYRNGAPIQDATNATYKIEFVLATDNGAKFKVQVRNASGTATSQEATLTVVSDTTPPQVADIGSDWPTSVFVVFDEPVEQGSAEKAANYQIQGGPAVTSAKLQADGKTVRLTVSSALAEGQWYTLIINGVKDRAVAGNTASNLQAKFRGAVFARGVVKYERWDGKGADYFGWNFANCINAIVSGTIGDPTVVSYRNGYTSPRDVADQYTGRLSGWFIPPQTGNYVFFMASDDYGGLYLSTDDNPANRKEIARETGWSGAYAFTTVGSGDVNAKRSDKYANTQWPGGNTIRLTAGQKYYLEVIWFEGGGGDGAEATFKLEGEPDPANSSAGLRLLGDLVGTYVDVTISEVQITGQPRSLTVMQNRPAKFTVSATARWRGGTTPFYQWQRAPAGSNQFTDIQGATSASYTIPLASLSDDGARFRVKVWVPGAEVYSDAVTLSVQRDTEPPKVVSAAVIPGKTIVGIQFDELVDQASAESLANYTVSGASVTKATLITQLGNAVRLDLSTPLNGPFTVTVRNVRDLAGNALAQATVNGAVADVTAEDVGQPGVDPVEPGWTVPLDENDFFVVGGGHDIWDNADGFHYVYKLMTGDFDVAVRVEGMDGPNWWSKAELMVRKPASPGAKPQGGDPHVCMMATRTAGQNEVNVQYRPARDQASDWPGTPPNQFLAEPIRPAYPNCWMRVKRTGTVLEGYYSTDGYNWIKVGWVDTATTAGFERFDGPVFVGLAVTSHDNNPGQLAWAIFRDFGPTPQGQPPAITRIALDQQGNVVIEFTGVLQQADKVEGPYTDIPGATSPYITAPTGKAKFFRARGQ